MEISNTIKKWLFKYKVIEIKDEEKKIFDILFNG